jgi:epoxyqueuosine reductase
VDRGLKERIRECAMELGFEDAGFTGVEPLEMYKREIETRPDMYSWVNTDGFSTIRGAAPASKHPWARSMTVLIRNYHRKAFPDSLLGRYGRCYQVDERKLRGEEYRRFKAFLDFLNQEGIRAWFDGEVPARMAAARAGVVTYGKNCFVFARKAMRKSSWLESIPILLDAEIAPDEPSIQLGCPPECDEACLKACPTGALYEPLKMNPLRCIAFHTYYGPPLTPLDLREPMGTWVYGCDRCQETCPRNRPWGKQRLPLNEPLLQRAGDFDLRKILGMSKSYYEERVWPQFFYISRDRVDRWQMNAARALGNQRDPENVPLLTATLEGSPFENVRAMSAWALGRVGSTSARVALERRRGQEHGTVADEIERALMNG